MDLGSTSKKRKSDDNGAFVNAPPLAAPRLTPEEALKILVPFSLDELRSVVSTAMVTDPSVLSSVRSVVDADPTRRKLFIRGLGWDTTSDSLRSHFSSFGDLDEAVVICDKATGKSKGYGFITFSHVDGALLALKEPSKKIDGRMTVTQLASVGNTGCPPTGPADAAVPASSEVALRKIYVGAVPADMSSERLLAVFSSYGEIEEGPIGLDKHTGKFRGYAMFVYKHAKAARAVVEDPMKFVDGHQITCKFANDGKKGKPGDPPPANPAVGGFDSKPGEAASFPGSMPGQFGVPVNGPSNYGVFSGAGGVPGHPKPNSPQQSSIGAGHSTMNSSVASSAFPRTGAGWVGGYGGGLGGPYSALAQFTGPGFAAGPGGYGGFGMGLAPGPYNRVPPNLSEMGTGVGSGGFPEGGRGYPEGGPYSMSSKGHSGQNFQRQGSPPRPRVPSGGGMHQGMPPYY